MLSVLLVLGMLIFMVLMLWGVANILLIGRKLVSSRAGRNRTSLTAVAREGRLLIIPLLLTEILRSCFTLLWGILFIIPGILYAIRTTFYNIIVVTEGIAYRKALQRSKTVVRGHTWAALWRIAVLLIVLYAPINLLSFIGYAAVDGSNATFAIDILDALLNAPATVISLLATVALYDELQSA